MSKIIINGNITGDHAQVGDRFYNSYSDYVTDKQLTPTEKELVKIIFENTDTEEERKTILQSLKSIKEEIMECDNVENTVQDFAKKNFQNFNKISYDLAVGLFTNLLSYWITSMKP